MTRPLMTRPLTTRPVMTRHCAAQSRADLDDELPELPPLAGSLDDEEEVGVDDAPLELDLGDGTEEGVGLDDRTGEGDPLDAAELLGEDAGEGDEREHWTDGTDEAGDALGEAALDDVEGAEYGWTEGTEAQADGAVADWDSDLTFGEEVSVLGEDAGEVGVEDDSHLAAGGDDDVVGLPQLDADSAEDDGDALAEDLDLAGDGLIEGAELSFEEEERLSGALLPAPLSPNRLRVTHLGPEDDALQSVALAPPGAAHGGLAAGEHLYALSAGGESLDRLDASGLEAHDLTSVALDAHDPTRVAVGTRLGGVACSFDGGRSFAPANAWQRSRGEETSSVAFFVTAEGHDEGTRLWGRTRAGALYRSDDFGRTWSSPLLPAPVLAFDAPAAGGVYALCVARRGPAQVAMSSDGGYRWTVRDVVAREDGAGEARVGDAPGLTVGAGDRDREHHIAALGEMIAVTAAHDPSGPLLSSDGGERWVPVPEVPAPGPVLLVDEGGPVLYAGLFFEGVDRGVVIRRPLDGEARVVLDVAEERRRRHIEPRGDAEGDNRVMDLVAERRGDVLCLWVASGAGLFRVEVLDSGGAEA